MPYRLHPSGYCAVFGETSQENLVPGKPCIFCGRVAGHANDCPDFVTYPFGGQSNTVIASGKSSRGSLYNAVSILWHRSRVKSFVTFTLPSLDHGTYQYLPDCEQTGDLAVTRMFSKVLEAWAVRVKRLYGEKLSYVWVSEAQMKRQEKFGGCGDLHFHLVVNQRIKADDKTVVDMETLQWVQDLWCKHVGASSNNCVHFDPIPDNVNSIPSYLAKYLGKGTQRRILSRRFGCSRDLSELKPITLNHAPQDVGLVRAVTKKIDESFSVTTEFYNTRDVIEKYGKYMAAESDFVGGAKGRASDFTVDAIRQRLENRSERIYWDKVIGYLRDSPPLPDATIRPLPLLSRSTRKSLGLIVADIIPTEIHQSSTKKRLRSHRKNTEEPPENSLLFPK